MNLDTNARMAAVRSRDARFDGFFYLGVRSTGIYCRPSCPARVPKDSNMSFYPSAAAAQGAGYRACKRCRPDATPGSPQWQERSDVVARVMRLIADGVLDREGVDGLAAQVGYSARQVERLVTAELGAGPLALARAQRAHTARLLIETTHVPMAQIAFAAGFCSIRSFNDTVRAVFASTPSELRALGHQRLSRVSVGGHPGDAIEADDRRAGQRIALRLPYRGPLHADSLFGHLAATAVPGVEQWINDGFARSVMLEHGAAVIWVKPAAGHIDVVLTLHDVRDLTAAMQRCRRMLDLDADPDACDAHLGTDPVLAPLIEARPGTRIPGGMDPAEMALRIVLGQHISTAAVGTLTGRIAMRLGTSLPPVFAAVTLGEHSTLDRLFPSAATLAQCDPTDLPGMPAIRLRTLRQLAAVLADGTLDVSAGSDWAKARAGLLGIPGIGPWTVEMIALRCLGDPDAFPSTDLGVRRTAAAIGLPDNGRGLLAHSAQWQPWRGYVTQSLWAASTHAAARMPTTEKASATS